MSVFPNDYETTISICRNCRGTDFVINSDAMYVCTGCGLVESYYVPMSCGLEWDKQSHQTMYNDPLSTKGRYKPIFHWNERISQINLALPEIPPEDWKDIERELSHGDYPAYSDLRPHHIVTMLRRLTLDAIVIGPTVNEFDEDVPPVNFMKYRERWKWILMKFNPGLVMAYVEPRLLEDIEPIYKAIEREFWLMRTLMPKSIIRSKTGKVSLKLRHNVLPFNYVFRKIMEMKGIYDFHWELPLLRSPTKLETLDRVMSVICQRLNLSFQPTPIIKWPKMKKSRKSKE